MIHVRAFFIGIVIIGIGIYFGDPVPQEFRIEAHDAIQFTGNKCNKNRDVEGEGERIAKIPLYTDIYIQKFSLKSP
jgi:hypothetical protein